MRAKKHFGQHFLVQPNTIRQIINACQLDPNEPVVEIGPGLGALTGPLLADGHTVTAIEIDRDAKEALREKFNQQALTIISADILKTPLRSLDLAPPLKVIGNLPYNISTPILFHLLDNPSLIKDMTFMLQKEVVDRICAEPNSKTYGRLSVMVQQACQVQSLFDIPPSAFAPPPKVMSSIMRLKPYINKSPYEPLLDRQHFALLVRDAFNQRRKTLRNALKLIVNADVWEACNIDPQCRAENLSVSDFVNLSNTCCSLNKHR